MGYHARLGPSGAYRWAKCTASPRAEDVFPDNSNDAARAGTAEHEAAAECLQHSRDPWLYLGREFVFLSEREEMWLSDLPAARHAEIKHRVVLDDEAIERIEAYVNFVNEVVQTSGGILLVENRVPVQHITGESYWKLDGKEVDEGTPGAVLTPAGGTADVIVIAGDEIIIIDYKSGQVRITAYDVIQPEGVDLISGDPTPALLAPNDQMAMYASGGIELYGWMADIKRVRMVIVQPRLGAVSEFVLSLDELNKHIDTLRAAATETRENPTFRAGDWCGFCKARVTCTARDEYVLSTVLDGFKPGDLVSLQQAPTVTVKANYVGLLYARTEEIKAWCGDIHRRVFADLAAGRPVINPDGVAYKLVEGRAGNRKWTDPTAVETYLRDTIRLPKEVAYNWEIISPADAEKLAKAKKARGGKPEVIPAIGKTQWSRLQELMAQEPGKPVISLASDPKPAIQPSVDGFSDSTNLFE